MPDQRSQITTSVDARLMEAARAEMPGATDEELLDAALAALRRKRMRSAEIDRSYEIYKEIPLDTPDEWGDLQSFLDARLPRGVQP